MTEMDPRKLGNAFAEGVGESSGRRLQPLVEDAHSSGEEFHEDVQAPSDLPHPKSNVVEGMTAFLVIIQPDGSPRIETNLGVSYSLQMEREATGDDIRRACMEVFHDCQAMKTAGMSAEQIAVMMNRAAVAAQARAQYDQVARDVMARGPAAGRKGGLHIPGG